MTAAPPTPPPRPPPFSPPPILPPPSAFQVQGLTLPAPPYDETLILPTLLKPAGPAPALRVKSKRTNKITDTDQWIIDHQVTLPTWEVPNPFRGISGNLPPHIPARHGELMLVLALHHPDHNILVYGKHFGDGRILIVTDPDGRPRRGFDFSAWKNPPTSRPGDERFTESRIIWAQVVSGVLLVSTAHSTYAASSAGKNGYLTALDLDTGNLFWRSQPLVANSSNFIVDRGWIISGYGFTDEPDFLYVLSARDGKVKSRTKLDSGPDILHLRGNQLLVRTYNRDYELTLK
jgi:hypothetical protein